MSDLLGTQRHYKDHDWEPRAWVERERLTPLADYVHHAPLMFCRERLPRDLASHSFLFVNAGEGTDTRYFQLEGVSSVAATDISGRALLMLRHHCPGARAVVAATERLPFLDDCFDFVGVRAGLHHLENPFSGLAEMARVARLGFFFVENHDTPLVPLLVRLGLLEHVEEAGNEVIRFTRAEVRDRLAQLGIADYTAFTGSFMQFWTLLPVSKWIPGRAAARILRAFVGMYNRCFGRFGNAFIVVARERPWPSG